MRKKRVSMFAMGIQNLKANHIRTWVMIFFVSLLSFTLFVGAFLMNSMQKGIENTEDKMGADLIVVPNQDSERLQESLYAGEPCTIYFERSWLEKVEQTKGIQRATAQLYLSTIDSACCDAPVQLIGINPKTDYIIKPWVSGEKEVVLQKGEVIVGANVLATVGEMIKFYDTDFIVAAKLEKTGMGYDNSAFMSFETIYELRDSRTANENLKLDNSENLISMVLADIDKETSIGRTRLEIREQDEGTDILVCSTTDFMKELSVGIEQFSSYGRVTVWLLFFASAMALVCIFTITINERKREFGIMYTMGAKRGQMASVIISEAMVLGFLGGVIGVALAGGGLYLFRNLVSVKLGIPYFFVTVEGVMQLGGVTLLIAILTGFLASLYSVWRISRDEPYKLIKENE